MHLTLLRAVISKFLSGGWIVRKSQTLDPPHGAGAQMARAVTDEQSGASAISLWRYRMDTIYGVAEEFRIFNNVHYKSWTRDFDPRSLVAIKGRRLPACPPN